MIENERQVQKDVDRAIEKERQRVRLRAPKKCFQIRQNYNRKNVNFQIHKLSV